MRKFLLIIQLCLMCFATTWAEEFNRGTDLGGSGRSICAVGTTTVLPNVNLYCIDDVNAKAAISYIGTGDFVIPEQLDVVWTTSPENGEPQTLRATWNVVQVNSITRASSVTIPASVQTIAPNAFAGGPTLIFEEGDSPIEMYPGYTDYESVELNRSIKAMPGTTGTCLGTTGTLKIGANVASIEGPVFLVGGNGVDIQKVEFANWNNWYNNTKLDCLEANPYRDGAEIWAGGFKITKVEIPEDATEIPDYKNVGLKFEGELFLPEGIKRIGDYAFANQKDLYYIEFPDGVEEIGNHAFENCELLTFEQLPEALTSIGEYAFSGCSAQEAIVLPEGVESVGRNAFANMTALKKAILFSKLTKVPDYLCAGCPELEMLYLPKEAATIGAHAFHGSTYTLESVILPSVVESIEEYAFAAQGYYPNDPARWGGISKISFPESLKSIGNNAFACQAIGNLKLNEGLTTLGDFAFSGNSIYALSLPSTLKTIGAGALSTNNANGIGRVIVPNNVTEMDDAFGQSWIGEMIIGDGINAINTGSVGQPVLLTVGTNVKNITTSALFNDNNSLKVLQIPTKTPPTLSEKVNLTQDQIDAITIIVKQGTRDAYMRNPYWKVFGNSIVEEDQANVTVFVDGRPISEEVRVQSGIMPSQVIKLKVNGELDGGDWRLIRENMVSLISLDLSGITNQFIPTAAFEGMSGLVELILPKNLTSIDQRAFSGCSLMDIPELPESLTRIEPAAFMGCSRLSINSIPESVIYIGSAAFKGCTSLQSMTLGSGVLQGAPGLDYWSNDAELNPFSVFEGCTALEFVDLSETEIKKLGNNYFKGCSNLATIILPSDLEEVGESAFEGTAIEYMNLPASVKTIGLRAFNSTALRSFNVPEGITSLDTQSTVGQWSDGGVFGNCAKLTAISFPSTLKSLGGMVLQNSAKVTSISCSAVEAPEAASGAFGSQSNVRCGLTIPQQSYRSYLNAPQWGKFATIVNRIVVEMPETIDVTYVDEAEYQEICEEIEYTVEAEAPVDGSSPEGAKRKAKQSLNADILSGRTFPRLFNDAMMFTPKTPKGNRVFINPKEGVTIEKVLLDGVDITKQLVDNSVVIPSASQGKLVISTLGEPKDPESGLDAIIAPDSFCTAYDAMGRVVYTGPRAALESSVAPGLYIVKAEGFTEKVLVK